MPETTTTSTNSLPSPALRDTVSAKLDELVEAVVAHPRMRTASSRHPTFYHVWDFAMRTRYIVSELDNVAAGRPVQHPEQLPGYRKPAVEGTPNPSKAKELWTDVFTRSVTLDMMMGNPVMLGMMGLQPVDFGDDIRAKAAAVVEALKAEDQS